LIAHGRFIFDPSLMLASLDHFHLVSSAFPGR